MDPQTTRDRAERVEKVGHRQLVVTGHVFEWHNTHTGRAIPNVKLKMFWDGFENLQERIKDELGRAMSLKVHH